MTLSPSLSQPGLLALRVGCLFEYDVVDAGAILLKIEPFPGRQHIFIDQILSVGSSQHFERHHDTHGNLMLSASLTPGHVRVHYDAILHLSSVAPEILPDGHALSPDVWMYTFPSRYCESDKLVEFALEQFGSLPAGLARARAVCDWTYQNIEYRYGSGDSSLSACEAIDRGYGVCRDFAHVMIALCRAMDMPARYVAGYVPLLAGRASESDIGIDFHAYVEVHVDGAWQVFDPRHSRLHEGRVKIAHGMDAIDTAIATFSDTVTPLTFKVWAYEVDLGVVRLEGEAFSDRENVDHLGHDAAGD